MDNDEIDRALLALERLEAELRARPAFAVQRAADTDRLREIRIMLAGGIAELRAADPAAARTFARISAG